MPIKYSFLLICSYCFFACSSPSNESSSQTETIENTSKESLNIASMHPLGQQMILVTTPDWDRPQGSLQRYEFTENKWQKIGEIIPIVVGKKGMAWGKGMEEMSQVLPMDGPIKREGDLKSPAGMFRLEAAFGYAEISEAQWIKSSYLPIKSYTQCIEDINSRYYNQIVADTLGDADWNSTDHMLRKDDLYEWGMVVAHNTEDREPGSGSCIFLHVGNPQGRGTAGCTAMEKDGIRELLAWIDPGKTPFMVQMPDFAYPEFKRKFELADI